MTVSIVQGHTRRIGPYTCKINGQPVDLTGMTVELLVRPKAGTQYSDMSGDVFVYDQTTDRGKVAFDPDAEDFNYKKSPYSLRFKVTDTGGKVMYFPPGEGITVVVSQP